MKDTRVTAAPTGRRLSFDTRLLLRDCSMFQWPKKKAAAAFSHFLCLSRGPSTFPADTPHGYSRRNGCRESAS